MSCVPSAMGGMASGVRVVVVVSRSQDVGLSMFFSRDDSSTKTNQSQLPSTSLVLLVFGYGLWSFSFRFPYQSEP